MQFLVVIRVFAFFLFLFLPALSVLMFFGFVVRDTHYFVGFGLFALVGNGVLLLFKPVRQLIGQHLQTISAAR
jgi:hypothetical protein